MSQTTLLSSINRTTDYPITVSSTADSHCGTLQLILGSDWTNQMIHELPAINISILTEDGSKFLSFDVNMSTVNEELRNKERSLSPAEPYSIAVYDIPKDITFSITPLFDQYALKAHNDLINDGNIEIFDTSNKGIVDTDSEDYSSELWTTPTSTFDITIIFDNSNVSGGGVSDYTELANKPSINNVTLVGNKSLSDLGIVNPMMIKGRVNSVSDLPQVAEAGWVYFVGQSDDADLEEYVYTVDNEWEFLGYSSIVIDSALSTTSENPVQNKVITNAMVGEKTTGKQYVIDGQTVTAQDGAEIFNSYTGNSQNKATGQYSHAEGVSTTATGHGSHAEGAGTTAVSAQCHAEGAGTTAAAPQSHAEGAGTRASGDQAHAEGAASQATGQASHAEGSGTHATSYYAHAEGDGTTASGRASHAEGAGTNAIGLNAHAEGTGSAAEGQSAHAEGAGCAAIGNYSHAEGAGTTAHFDYSHAEGEATLAESTHQHVQGKFNFADANNIYAFIIGNGTADNARHNAFAIDWNGNIYVNNSATGINVETLSSILNPISESEYEAITTKDKPLYFIYD